jgi:hypothetical protein
MHMFPIVHVLREPMQNKDLKLSNNVVTSSETDLRRVGAAIYDDECFWAVLRLEMAVRLI